MSLQVICTLSLLLTPAMTDLAENIYLVLEAQYQQLTPFTSIVPFNFEAATMSHNPEGFVQGSRCSAAVGLYVHATS